LPTIAQISDLHLQSGVPERQAQIEPILQAINDAKPDLVVISGDLTDDGWNSIDELKWAKNWLNRRIHGEWFAVPGNHDVGNFAGSEQGAINEERVKHWERVFGWNVASAKGCDVGGRYPGWHIAGINTMLLGSGNKYDTLQRNWLRQHLPRMNRLSVAIAVMVHTPMFVNHHDEQPSPTTDYWLGPADARAELWQQFQDAGVKLIACGHVHQTRIDKVGDMQVVWAPPASGTWVHAPGLPNPPAPEQTGFVMYHLGPDGSVRSEVIECAPMRKSIYYDPSR